MNPLVAPLAPALGPTAVLRVHDRLRRHQLECVLDRAPDGEADVLVVELAPGEDIPHAGRAALLVLSDDPAHAADASLPGVLPRNASARQIAAAVACLAEGLTVRLPGLPAPAPAAQAASPLTPREMEILGLIAQGFSNKGIARRLGISAHTVKYHLEAVFAKLAVRSRAEAATQGLRRGLVVL
jgi:two-component system nitrate/nitrite response regulator NarL